MKTIVCFETFVTNKELIDRKKFIPLINELETFLV